MKSERANHKYLRKYRGKNGKWVYIYKEGKKKSGDTPEINALPKIVKADMNRIRNHKYEIGIFYNKYNEKIDEMTDDEPDTLEYDDDDIKYIRGQKPTIFIHNHPNSASFSINDIATASIFKVPKIIATSKKADYLMVFKKSFMNKSIKTREKIVNKLANHYILLNEMTVGKFLDAIDAGKMTVEEADFIHFHNLIENLVKTFPEVFEKYERKLK